MYYGYRKIKKIESFGFIHALKKISVTFVAAKGLNLSDSKFFCFYRKKVSLSSKILSNNNKSS